MKVFVLIHKETDGGYWGECPELPGCFSQIVETFAKIRALARTLSQLPEVQGKEQQKALMQKSGEILADILDDNALEVSGDETTFELNLAFVKIKRTVKRSKPKLARKIGCPATFSRQRRERCFKGGYAIIQTSRFKRRKTYGRV
ncbi:hypothetical protein AGMMS50276_28420 [Synergistales bacterium]|nr:hypothetical protein AGMMS50276_28420 [Synergistales bacterium]